MPRISSFYGIVVWMYWGDHQPPHFHAEYGEQSAVVDIENLQIVRGDLPPRAFRLVSEWADLHRQELADNWQRAQKRESLVPIEPLS